jgi:hypothetical protein
VLILLVHGYSKLLLSLLGELECVDLWGNAAHGGTRLEGLHLAQLLRLQQAHVNILLVRGSNLLLLLLEQLNLLLNGQLFHHQWGKLRRTSPMSNMELAPTRTLRSGLTLLLIHDSR